MAVITQILNDRLIKHYSDEIGMMLLQVETGEIYDEAIDVIPCRYTYEEILEE